MLRELKNPLKSPASLPAKSPILYIIKKVIVDQVQLRVVLASNVKLGKSIKVMRKSKKMKRGQGRATFKASHMTLTYDLGYSKLLLSLLTKDCEIGAACSLLSSSMCFYIFYLYYQVLNICMLRNKSKKLYKQEIEKQMMMGIILPGSLPPKPMVMIALKIISAKPEAAVPIVKRETVFEPKQLIIAKNESWAKLEKKPTINVPTMLNQNPKSSVFLQVALIMRSKNKEKLVTVTPQMTSVRQSIFRVIQLNIIPVNAQAIKQGIGKYKYTLQLGQMLLKQSNDPSTAFHPNRAVMPLSKNRFYTLLGENACSCSPFSILNLELVCLQYNQNQFIAVAKLILWLQKVYNYLAFYQK